MNWIDFVTRMIAALMFGGIIGVERQWRQRMTGLRTNGSVAVGSVIFVMMGALIQGPDSQGRVASYVVSGIGTPEEAHIRALLLQNVGRAPLTLVALHSKDHESIDRVDVSISNGSNRVVRNVPSCQAAFSTTTWSNRRCSAAGCCRNNSPARLVSRSISTARSMGRVRPSVCLESCVADHPAPAAS